jgi:hypothetical protein
MYIPGTAVAGGLNTQVQFNDNGLLGGDADFTFNKTTNQIAIAAGSAAAPTLIPTGDTNTGLFFPAADTIAFAEGGAEAMRIDSSGNVGIGTTSPGAKLQVNSEILVSDGTITLRSTVASGVSFFGPITSHPLAIQTNNVERMRVTAAGDVGIGTSTPAAKLDVVGGIISDNITTDTELDYNYAAASLPVNSPALDLNFAGSETVDSRVTFTRSTTATFVGSNGLIQSAAINVPRIDFSPTTLECLGLLIEEQRTNLLLNSATLSAQSVTVTATAHTLSFYGTGTVTLSGASSAGPLVGTGVYPNRVTLTFTPTAGTLTLTVTGTVSNAQLEAGAFATSYIPTAAASVTRNADVASVATSQFPYSATASSIVVNVSLLSTSPISAMFALSDGTINNFINTYQSTGTAEAQVYSGGVEQAAISRTTVSAGGQTKVGVAVTTNDAAFVLNGGAAGTDTSVTMPAAAASLYLGLNFNGSSNPINGHIRQITYFPRRLTNAELQAVSTL